MEEVKGYLDNPKLTLYQMEEHSKEWHDFRKNGLGGSDAAAVMGASKYRSRLELFLEKIGYYNKPREAKAPLVWGTVLEDTVLDMWRYMNHEVDGYLQNYENKSPQREYKVIPGYVVNSDFPWLFHSTDAIIPAGQASPYTGEVMEEDGILEAKTIDSMHARLWEKGYPPYYQHQVQQYMLGLGMGYAELAIFNLNRSLYGDVFFPDYDIQEEIVTRSHDLWGRILEGRKVMDKGLGEQDLIQELTHLQPDISDDNPDSLLEFMSRNAKLSQEKVLAPENIRRSAVNLVKLQKMIKLLTEKKKTYEIDVRKFSMDNQAYRLDFDKPEDGYIKFSTRANSNKLTITNKATAEVEDTLGLLDELFEEVRE